MSRKRPTALEARALELAEEGPLSPRDLSRAIGCTIAGARSALRRLAERGDLVSHGVREGGHARRPEVFGLPGGKPEGHDRRQGDRRRRRSPPLPADLEGLSREELIELVQALMGSLETLGLGHGLEQLLPVDAGHAAPAGRGKGRRHASRKRETRSGT